jgi:outer membrane protein OmpA-like peptidoglycan-associated protein
MVFFSGISACSVQKRIALKKHHYMEKVYMGMKDSVKEADVSMLNDTIKILFPEDLLFPLGKSELLPSTIPLLKRFAGALNKYSNTSILINGYTDNTGSKLFNSQLSVDRAKNTGEVLKSFNVSSSRFFYWGRGSVNPVANNHTKDGRRRNRRVEFIILYNCIK